MRCYALSVSTNNMCEFEESVLYLCMWRVYFNFTISSGFYQAFCLHSTFLRKYTMPLTHLHRCFSFDMFLFAYRCYFALEMWFYFVNTPDGIERTENCNIFIDRTNFTCFANYGCLIFSFIGVSGCVALNNVYAVLHWKYECEYLLNLI